MRFDTRGGDINVSNASGMPEEDFPILPEFKTRLARANVIQQFFVICRVIRQAGGRIRCTRDFRQSSDERVWQHKRKRRTELSGWDDFFNGHERLLGSAEQA